MHICNEEGLNLDAQVFKLALFVMNQMMFICIIHYYDNIISGQLVGAFFHLIITWLRCFEFSN